MIIGTAGHIDHGKSALVRALTGREMDRLAEERKRGITIELNFAPLDFEGLALVGIVDVPGHEDLVRTMVAGASGIDLLLLVVDAREGIMPQTLEHLAIAEQLGVTAGVPVLTKSDLVEPGWLELVREDLEGRLASSPIRFDPVTVVSALSGEGIAGLKDQLRSHAAAWAGALRQDDLFRMPVDRVFSLAGAGTVVTGTVWDGSVRLGDQVRVEPGGGTGRVRSLESFGHAAEVAQAGSRAAISLAGLSRTSVSRGQVLVGQTDAWDTTEIIDGVVTLLPGAAHSIATRTRVRFHHGTAEVMARAYPREAIPPGGTGLARIVLEHPVVLRGGDRFVIRSYSPVQTIGGGWVADPSPPRRASWPAGLSASDPAERLAALAERRRAGVPAEAVAVLTGVLPAATAALVASEPDLVAVSGRIGLARWLAEAETALQRSVRRHHAEHPSLPGPSQETLRQELGPDAWLADAALDRLVVRGALTRSGGIVSEPGYVPRAGGGEGEVLAIVEAVAQAGLEGVTLAELKERLGLADLAGAIRIAVTRGAVEAIERDRFVGKDALASFRAVLRSLAEANVEISPAALRERLGLSRKYLIPLLEWGDRSGVTHRDAAGRRILR